MLRRQILVVVLVVAAFSLFFFTYTSTSLHSMHKISTRLPPNNSTDMHLESNGDIFADGTNGTDAAAPMLTAAITHIRTEADSIAQTLATVALSSTESISTSTIMHLGTEENVPASTTAPAGTKAAVVAVHDPCAGAKAAAIASAAAIAVAAQSQPSWPIIINASLVVVDRNYIDGWVIKGSDIVASAVFEGQPDSHSIHLIDAHGSHVPCRAQQITYAGKNFRCMIVYQMI
jgi:hypothetical protein